MDTCFGQLAIVINYTSLAFNRHSIAFGPKQKMFLIIFLVFLFFTLAPALLFLLLNSPAFPLFFLTFSQFLNFLQLPLISPRTVRFIYCLFFLNRLFLSLFKCFPTSTLIFYSILIYYFCFFSLNLLCSNVTKIITKNHELRDKRVISLRDSKRQ